MNNKGFTLVEVLATFVLMGIILGIAFPAIDNLYRENKTQKYETYETALKTAAKLYVDQYDRDLWQQDTPGCVRINYSDIKCEGLIKDFDKKTSETENNEIVDANSTYVYAIKNNGTVKYEIKLVIKKGSNTTYETKKNPTTTGCIENPIKDYCQFS